jgi:hypothetical protein
VYWKDFWVEFEEYGHDALDLLWHTSNQRFFDQVQPGDNLWIVVFWAPDEWRLIQRLHIRRLRIESGYERPYHAIGDDRSQTFRLDRQPDFAPILRKLEFVSGKRIKAMGRLIGRSLQTSRPLSEGDIHLLRNYTKKLKVGRPIKKAV